MATRRQKAKVGAFLVMCAALITAGVVIISGWNHEERINYWAEFQESVLGLTTGSVVTYMGVDVGRVSDIYVTSQNKAHVEMMISPSKVTLRKDVKAQLVMWSIATGTLCVSLSGGVPGGPELPPGKEIKTELSLIKSFSTQMEDLLAQVKRVTEQIEKGLAGMDEGDLAKVIDDADVLLKQGQDFLGSANTTLTDVKGKAEAGLDDFHDLSEELKKLVKDTNEAVNVAKGKIEQLEVDKTQENVNKVLEEVRELAKKLQESSANLDSVSKSAIHEADNIEYNLRDTLTTLNESLEAIRDLTLYLQQDPSALVRGKGRSTGEK